MLENHSSIYPSVSHIHVSLRRMMVIVDNYPYAAIKPYPYATIYIKINIMLCCHCWALLNVMLFLLLHRR